MKDCIKQNKLLLFFTVLFSVISSSIMVFVARLFQKTIDYAVNRDIIGFKQTLIFTILYVIGIGIFYFIYDILSKKFLKNMIKLLREKIFTGILRKSYSDFTSNKTADYISVLTNDMKILEENYILPLLMTLQNITMFVVTLALLLFISPIVTGALLLSLLLLFIVPALFGKPLQTKQNILSNRFSIFTSKLKDIFSGYEVIKSFSIQKNISDEFYKENEILADAKYNTDKLIVVNETLSQILGMSTQFVAILLSSYLVLIGNITVGTLLALVQLSGTLTTPIVMILNSLPKIQSVKPILIKIEEIIEYTDNDFKGNLKPNFNKAITLSNLNFSYEDKRVLNNIDLIIEKNKKYAIVGGSGSGKSTLIKLILGYYSTFEGNIQYDGINIPEINPNHISDIASIIHQNVYMFDKTIEENISLYKDFSKNYMDYVVSLSGVNKFLGELENGLSTILTENASNISGGQRQRIAIARALLRKTPLLILDEGTSSIDNQTSYEIEDTLLNIKTLTLITITHKLNENLLKLYDKIIFMDKGEIVAINSFNNLMKDNIKFQNFYKLKS